MILLISSTSIVLASIYILDVDYFHEFLDELNPWDEFGPYQGSAARVWITDLIPDNAHVRVQIARYEAPWLLPYWEGILGEGQNSGWVSLPASNTPFLVKVFYYDVGCEYWGYVEWHYP